MSGVRVPPPASALDGQIRVVEPKARGIGTTLPDPYEPPRTPYGLTFMSPVLSPGASLRRVAPRSLMANWRKTKTSGVYVAHQRRCPAFATRMLAAGASRRGAVAATTASRASPNGRTPPTSTPTASRTASRSRSATSATRSARRTLARRSTGGPGLPGQARRAGARGQDHQRQRAGRPRVAPPRRAGAMIGA